MAYEELDALLNEETLRLELFGSEARARLQVLMRDIEQEFREFIDRMLGEQTARLEREAAALSAQGEAPSFRATLGAGIGQAVGSTYGDRGDSLLGSAFSSALTAAAGTLASRGSLNPRTVANAGGRVIASAISSSFRASPDSVRLSDSQIGEALLKELTRAGRNR